MKKQEIINKINNINKEIEKMIITRNEIQDEIYSIKNIIDEDYVDNLFYDLSHFDNKIDNLNRDLNILYKEFYLLSI